MKAPAHSSGPPHPANPGETPLCSNPSYVRTGRAVTAADRRLHGLSPVFYAVSQTILAPFSQYTRGTRAVMRQTNSSVMVPASSATRFKSPS